MSEVLQIQKHDHRNIKTVKTFILQVQKKTEQLHASTKLTCQETDTNTLIKYRARYVNVGYKIPLEYQKFFWFFAAHYTEFSILLSTYKFTHLCKQI